MADQTKIQLNEIIKIENCFKSETNHRKSCSKKLSIYVTAFDYIDKILIILFVKAGGVCVVSHVTIVGASAGIAIYQFTIGFTILFSLATGIIKTLLSVTRNKMKKDDKILTLAKS